MLEIGGRARLALAAASTAAAATGLITMATAPAAHAAVSPGEGSSYAQSLAAAPHDGSLAVGVTLGEALAGHTNSIARAQSQGIDLGAIGTAATGYNCGSQSLQPDQIPQAYSTETGQPGAAQGETQTFDPSQGTNQPSYGTYEHVQATAAPYGEADTAFGPVSEGPVAVTGMKSRAWSGLQNGQRAAGASSDIASLDIAGVVHIDGLHWQSVYPSGGSARPQGSFDMGSLTVAGQVVPVHQSLQALQDVINSALGQVGLEVLLPVASTRQGTETVTPLQIEVVPNQTRDGLVNPALNATESQQQTVLGGLENGFPGEPAQVAQALCQSDTPITVAQVALASVNGGGYLSVALGGVDSSSGDVPQNPFSLGFAGLSFSGGLGAPGGPTPAGSAGSFGAPPVGGGSGSAPVATSGAATPSAPIAATPAATATTPTTARPAGGSSVPLIPASTRYAAGGPLLAIGLAGLALIGALAEGDRRMMRRAQHTVQFEE
ncbi:MAG TPA: hypothetical protein VFN68_12640 [Acidimicrobiales bacterium]|nr:hypothetical protein [Acidimicrobiales bacterium]